MEPKKLSVKQQKKKQQAIEGLKRKLAAHLEKKKNEKREQKVKFSPPLYDEVYYEALATFDALDGKPIEESEGTAHFSDDIWTSKARFDPNVS